MRTDRGGVCRAAQPSPPLNCIGVVGVWATDNSELHRANGGLATQRTGPGRSGSGQNNPHYSYAIQGTGPELPPQPLCNPKDRGGITPTTPMQFKGKKGGVRSPTLAGLQHPTISRPASEPHQGLTPSQPCSPFAALYLPPLRRATTTATTPPSTMSAATPAVAAISAPVRGICEPRCEVASCEGILDGRSAEEPSDLPGA